jgi:hypothetical protein
MKPALLALPVLALTLAASACASSHRTSPAASGPAANSVSPSNPELGSLVGAVHIGGGPVVNSLANAGGLVSIFNPQGRVIARVRITRGHKFRFRLPAGRYRLGYGAHPEPRRLGGCRPTVTTVRAGRTTHHNLLFGCTYH